MHWVILLCSIASQLLRKVCLTAFTPHVQCCWPVLEIVGDTKQFGNLHLLAGKLYDPETGLICGLRPTHLITLATPHLGCEAGDSPAQVSPFLTLNYLSDQSGIANS